MQGRSGKALAEKYHAFQNPAVKVFAEGKELVPAEGMYLDSTQVVSSVKREPDMAVLVYRASCLYPKALRALEERLALGQKMEVRAGYGSEVSRIFLGYLHEVSVSDAVSGCVEYTLLCLDVKGLMKKNNVFQVSGTKKVQKQLEELAGMGCYSRLVEKKKIDALPPGQNLDGVIRGETHYDWLCGLAERLDYEFFCGRGEFVFRKAQQAESESLELTGEYGLKALRAIVSMTGQTGSLRVSSRTRAGERLGAAAQWPGVPGPFAQRLKQTLGGFSLSVWDTEPETAGEAELLAKAAMRRRVRQCSRMEAVNAGLPELAPGIWIGLANDKVQSLSGRVYVEEAEHRLDEKGYETIVRGVRG